MSMWNYVGVYILGGITLVPSVVLLGYFMAPKARRIPLNDPLPEPQDVLSDQMLGPVQAAAWFNLSPYFVNLGEQDDEFAMSNVKAREQLQKSLDDKPDKPPSKATLAKLPRYYGTVRGQVLQVWTDESCTKRVSTIKLQDHVVTLWPLGGEDFELFYKRFPICLVSRTARDGLVALDLYPNTPPASAHYLYIDNPCIKEDLYFALIAGSRTAAPDTSIGPRDPLVMAQPLELETEDVHELLGRIYSSEESTHTQWINALLGRLFLAVKKSRQLDTYVRNKVVFKLTKVKPSWIGDITVQNVQIGSSLPFFDDIKLKTFAVDGNMTLEGDVTYSGGFYIEVAFTCFVNVPGLISREVKCVLAVKLLSLKGKLVVRIKPSPSSHLWYGFKEMPQMDLKIEPMVGSRQINYGFITNALKSMISDAVKESMVLPYMDDVPFCDTSDEFYRGGIWDASLRPTNVVWEQPQPRAHHKRTGSDHVVLSSSQSVRSVSSVSSNVSANGAPSGSPAAEQPEAEQRPVAKFWRNFVRRKAGEPELASPPPPAPASAATPAPLMDVTPTSTPTALGPHEARSGASSAYTSGYASESPANSSPTLRATTAVTNASVHGVQSGIYLPPKTFASRKPVPGVVTAETANASFDSDFERDPSEDREDSDLTKHAVPRKPVPQLRASRSLQQLTRVASRSSQRGHSPSSSLSNASVVSNVSRVSNLSQRKTVRLENVAPEPQPRPSRGAPGV